MAKIWLCYVSLLALAVACAANSTATTDSTGPTEPPASSAAAPNPTTSSTAAPAEPDSTTAQAEGTTAKELSEANIVLTCSAQTITVKIPKDIVPRIEADELGFGNGNTSYPQCRGTSRDNDMNIVLTANLTECGTNMTETNDTEVYTNSIINVYAHDDVISRGYEVNIPLTCRYNRTQRLGGMDNVSYVLTDYDITNQLEQEGSYKLEFDIFTHDDYTTPFDSYPVTFQLNDELYFAASLDYPNDELVLSMRACRATPDSNYDNGDYFDFIKAGCPNDENTNITNANGGSKTVQVKTNTFRFIDHGEFVYIHCDLLVCDASDNGSVCIPDDCSGTASQSRKRRDVSSSLNSKRFTRGPLRVLREAEVERIDPGFSSMNLQEQESAPQQAASSAMNPWVMAIAILGLAVMALAAMMVIVLSKVNRMTVSSRPDGIKE